MDRVQIGLMMTAALMMMVMIMSMMTMMMMMFVTTGHEAGVNQLAMTPSSELGGDCRGKPCGALSDRGT